MMIGIGTPSNQSNIPRPMARLQFENAMENGMASVWFRVDIVTLA